MTIFVSFLGMLASLILGALSSQAMEGLHKIKKKSGSSALIVKQNHKILYATGEYDKRQPPYSTFKVALVLMGFDSGILKTKDSPKWAFKEEFEKKFPAWYSHEKGLKHHWCQDHTPQTFIRHSVLWFSHQITERLGRDKFEEYVSRLNYGNKDVSGTPGKDDGLFKSWLGTSLKISPREQVEFLEKMLSKDLSLSKESQKKTKEIMSLWEEWEGWKLYAKTGGGFGPSGWCIGWIEKGEQKIIFAKYLDLRDSGLNLKGINSYKPVGFIAKEIVKKEILKLLRGSGSKQNSLGLDRKNLC